LTSLRDHPHVGDIRQKGLMVGIELVADQKTGARFDPNRRTGHQFCSEIRRHGVILRR
jgi:adenosylmethionine-8-amino-7-oxononanoate aminotransferase